MSSPAPESVPTAASRLSATPTGCGTNTASRTYAPPKHWLATAKRSSTSTTSGGASCCRKSRMPDTTRSGNWKIISTWRSSRRTSTTCTSGPAARTSPTCTANCVNCAAAPTNRWSYRSKVGNNTSTTAPRTDRCCVRSWSFSARASRCSTARPESPLRRIY